MSKVNIDEHSTSSSVVSSLSNKALRYDLTVPFARYVVQNRNEISFPFKRYQIQNVWRADRPQKGRFREFTQCDADVIGTDSLISEIELIQLFDDVFSSVGLKSYRIKLNNRKVLSGIAEVLGVDDYFVDITVAFDKLEKIGTDKVKQELLAKGLSPKVVEKLSMVLDLKGANREKTQTTAIVLVCFTNGLQGLEELDFLVDAFDETPLKTATLEFDVCSKGLELLHRSHF